MFFPSLGNSLSSVLSILAANYPWLIKTFNATVRLRIHVLFFLQININAETATITVKQVKFAKNKIKAIHPPPFLFFPTSPVNQFNMFRIWYNLHWNPSSILLPSMLLPFLHLFRHKTKIHRKMTTEIKKKTNICKMLKVLCIHFSIGYI